MLVQRINNSVPFGGAKEIDAIAKKYGRTQDDMKLVQLAKIAEDADYDITSDGEFAIPCEREKVDTFRKAAQESENEKLAFYLLNDFKKSSGSFYFEASGVNMIMKGIAQRSDKISKQEVLDYMV